MKMVTFNSNSGEFREITFPCKREEFDEMVSWGHRFCLIQDTAECSPHGRWYTLRNVHKFGFDPNLIPDGAFLPHAKDLWFIYLGMEILNGYYDWTITRIEGNWITLEGEPFSELVRDSDPNGPPMSELEAFKLQRVESGRYFCFQTIRGIPNGNWVGKTLREFKRAQKALNQ